MRSIRFFLMAAWLCLSLGAFAQTPDFYVSENGDDGFPGTEVAPFRTITHAISQAGNGDIIQLLAGELTEGNITVNKPVTISGLGEEVSLAPADGNTQLFSISANNVTIEGINLTGGNTNANAIVVGGVDGLTISQNTISEFVTGIVIAQNAVVTNLSVNNNFIISNENGIVINPAVQITGAISDNDLSGNVVGLVNNSTVLVNASSNWWGGVGFSDVTGELAGGNINNRIDYNPWLNSAIDGNPEDGFQPIFNVLNVRKQNNNPVLSEAIEKLDIGGKLFIYNKLNSASAYEATTVSKAVNLAGAGNQNPVITALTLGSDITLSGNITANNLALEGFMLNVSAQESGKLFLPLAVAANLSTQEGEVEGPVITLPEQIGSGESIQALGVSIPGGVEPLGEVTIQRNAGTAVVNENNNFQSIDVIWDITVENNNFAARDVIFQWSEAYDNRVEIVNAVVWKNPGTTDTAWEPLPQGPFDAEQEGSDIRSLTVSITSFSQYTVSDVNKPLPVELTSFSASLLEPHVELNWETASEINSDFFAVERSENGKDFKEVGRLKAAGDSDAPLQYRYIDEQVANRLSGSVFYRLRTVDFDGSFEYSDITTVTLSDDDIPMITAFAREGQQSLKLFTRAIEPGDYRVWITDLSGRKVFEQDLQLAPKESYELGVGNLSQSIYLIRCEGKQLALSNKFRVEEID